MRGARIAGEEGVGAEQDGGVAAVDQLGHGAVVQGRRIEIDRHARDQRQDRARRHPERVEHRQHVEQLVAAAEVDACCGLRSVRQHVAVGEHDALGSALGARCEQDHRRFVGLAGHERVLEPHQPPQLVARGDLCPQVLEVDDAHGRRELRHHRVELALLDEHTGGDDGRNLRRLASREDVGGTGGEVDHRRHAPRRHHAEDGDDRAIGVRQHHAQRLAFGGKRHQLAAEHRGADQQAPIGERAGHGVLDRAAPQAVHAGGRDDRFGHGLVGRRGAEHEVGHDLIERGARRLATLPALQLGRDREIDRLQHRDGHLREPAAAHLAALEPRERRRLEPVDAHRHDQGT